jgi:PAS domain S-box-containing protein
MGDQRKSKAELIAELRALRERLAAAEAQAAASGAPGAQPSRDEGRYRHILENMRAVAIEFDAKGRLTYVSPTVQDILGYTPEEALSRSAFEWVHEDDAQQMAEFLSKAIETGRSERGIHRARHKAGHWLWMEVTTSSYRKSDGSLRFIAFSRDITEMKRAAEALRDSEERFRAMAENASDFISELDEEGRFLFASPSCQEIFGQTPEAFIGKTVAELGVPENVHPDDRKALLNGFEKNVLGRGEGRREFRIRRTDGTWRWLESTAKTYWRSDGALRVVVIGRDTTERVLAQQELHESEERYRVVADASSDLISELDVEGRMVYASPHFDELLGFPREEIVGTTPFALIHPDDIDRTVATFLSAVESESPVDPEPFRARHRDGSWRWFKGRGIPFRTAGGKLRFLTVSRDVTERLRAERERRELEERMQQAQKLESLGVMAGGIAHDFNNLLTPILGGTTLALMDLPPESPARVRIKMIQKAAHRAAALTNQMLAYTGKESLRLEVLNLSKLVEEMGQLLESATSKKAEISYDLPEELPPVEADAAQLSQVVMNLITNASEAIGDEPGRISVRTGTMQADRAYLSRTLRDRDMPEGTYVYFEVSDTGCGMEAETRARIFDPFFTTRFTGRGLGLAAVLGIVRSHRGAIELDSVPGLGTRFRVLLPRSERSYPCHAPEPAAIETWRGSGTVLLVDDDEGVRELAHDILTGAGLQVLCACDGREAVTVFREHADEIRAVLLDRTMPASSGEEAFEEIRRIRPDVPVVLVSGYSKESVTDHFAGKDLTGFLHKPFLPATLLVKVRELLEG